LSQDISTSSFLTPEIFLDLFIYLITKKVAGTIMISPEINQIVLID